MLRFSSGFNRVYRVFIGLNWVWPCWIVFYCFFFTVFRFVLLSLREPTRARSVPRSNTQKQTKKNENRRRPWHRSRAIVNCAISSQTSFQTKKKKKKKEKQQKGEPQSKRRSVRRSRSLRNKKMKGKDRKGEDKEKEEEEEEEVRGEKWREICRKNQEEKKRRGQVERQLRCKKKSSMKKRMTDWHCSITQNK